MKKCWIISDPNVQNSIYCFVNMNINVWQYCCNFYVIAKDKCVCMRLVKVIKVQFEL